MNCAIRLRDVVKSYPVHEDGSAVTLGEALRGKVSERRVKRIVEAVRGVTLDIHDGERVGIIGPNGAGKSTLLQMITGVNRPTSGTIEIDGKVSAILTVGAGLREEATGRENFYLEGAVLGLSRGEVAGKIDDAIAFADIGDFIDRPVRTYSTGMKARLAFSTLAFIKPEILVIDEVLAVGDPAFAVKAAARMRALADQGRIVILVSHGLGSILEFCNRCLWVEDGRIVMDGAPEEVVRAYENRQRKADEAAMLRKFEDALGLPAASGGAAILELSVRGADGERRAVVEARKPVALSLKGAFDADADDADLEVSITRVDGEKIWTRRLREAGAAPRPGPFSATIELDPFVLGVSLYRLDAVITAGGRPAAGRSSAFEVVDADPQFGGQPMLFAPPFLQAAPLDAGAER